MRLAGSAETAGGSTAATTGTRASNQEADRAGGAAPVTKTVRGADLSSARSEVDGEGGTTLCRASLPATKSLGSTEGALILMNDDPSVVRLSAVDPSRYISGHL